MLSCDSMPMVPPSSNTTHVSTLRICGPWGSRCVCSPQYCLLPHLDDIGDGTHHAPGSAGGYLPRVQVHKHRGRGRGARRLSVFGGGGTS